MKHGWIALFSFLFLYVAIYPKDFSVAGSEVQSTAAVCSWTGTWSTHWSSNSAEMQLVQIGTAVSGVYEWDDGVIVGIVNGNELTGEWSESPSYGPPNDGGYFQFTMAEDCNSFTGKWQYGNSGTLRTWNGSRIDNGPCDSTEDTDGDALFDGWEFCGYTHSDGTFIDLPAMGASPFHKDVFVEIDYMESYGPLSSSIKIVVDSFDLAPVENPDRTTGIHLHVDMGSESPLRWANSEGSNWGDLSESSPIPSSEFVDNQFIGTCRFDSEWLFSWSKFNSLQALYFDEARAPIFHYNIWGDRLCDIPKPPTGIADDQTWNPFSVSGSRFVVTLGGNDPPVSREYSEAGTFMHELGHNLGLQHGGSDYINHKPNYISVMNYTFQHIGLDVFGNLPKFDYSREQLPTLNELGLIENNGIGTNQYGTRWFCPNDKGGGTDMDLVYYDGKVDWNCDKDVIDTVNGDINNDGNVLFEIVLRGHDDWNNLIYNGGAVGGAGASIGPIVETPSNEITQDEIDLFPPILTVYIPLATSP